MAKESLFNIIGNHFNLSTISVLDLFTGTGNISYEFVSRGCLQVTALDSDPRCIKFVKQTALKLNYSEITAIRSDCTAFLKHTTRQWDLIFADPPYSMENVEYLPQLIRDNNLLKKGGWLVIEHEKHIEFTDQTGLFDHRKYGKVNFSFFGK